MKQAGGRRHQRQASLLCAKDRACTAQVHTCGTAGSMQDWVCTRKRWQHRTMCTGVQAEREGEGVKETEQCHVRLWLGRCQRNPAQVTIQCGVRGALAGWMGPLHCCPFPTREPVVLQRVNACMCSCHTKACVQERDKDSVHHTACHTDRMCVHI